MQQRVGVRFGYTAGFVTVQAFRWFKYKTRRIDMRKSADL